MILFPLQTAFQLAGDSFLPTPLKTEPNKDKPRTMNLNTKALPMPGTVALMLALAGFPPSLTKAQDAIDKPVAPVRSYQITPSADLFADAEVVSPSAALQMVPATGEKIARLRSELADLEKATKARRRVIEEALAREIAEQQRRMALQARKRQESRSTTAAYPYYTPAAPAVQPPQWIIGVSIQQSSETRSKTEGGEEENSEAPQIIVAGLSKDMPAEKSGFKTGDVIISCNGIKLRNLAALQGIINVARDQELSIKVARTDSDQPIVLKVTLVRAPNPYQSTGILPPHHPRYGTVPSQPPTTWNQFKGFDAAGGLSVQPAVPGTSIQSSRKRQPGASSRQLDTLRAELKQLQELVAKLVEKQQDEKPRSSDNKPESGDDTLSDTEPAPEAP